VRLFPRPALASACDATALLTFVVVGLLSHRGGISGSRLAGDALPLLGGWFAAAALLRLYVRPSPARLGGTWLLGVSAGVAVRALVLGHTQVGREAAFLGVSLAFSFVFVPAARLLAGFAPAARA
jgi:Protein of unknown function (DUF3054)